MNMLFGYCAYIEYILNKYIIINMARYDRVHRGYYDVKNVIINKTKDDSLLSRDDETKTNIFLWDAKCLHITVISLLILSLFGLIYITLYDWAFGPAEDMLIGTRALIIGSLT